MLNEWACLEVSSKDPGFTLSGGPGSAPWLGIIKDLGISSRVYMRLGLKMASDADRAYNLHTNSTQVREIFKLTILTMPYHTILYGFSLNVLLNLLLLLLLFVLFALFLVFVLFLGCCCFLFVLFLFVFCFFPPIVLPDLLYPSLVYVKQTNWTRLKAVKILTRGRTIFRINKRPKKTKNFQMLSRPMPSGSSSEGYKNQSLS